MIEKVKLTELERVLIRKIAELQIKALSDIITENCEEDIKMYCIMNGININDLKNFEKQKRKVYEYIYFNPEQFISLPRTDLDMIRHILFNYFTNSRFDEAKVLLWNKMNILETLSYNLN